MILKKVIVLAVLHVAFAVTLLALPHQWPKSNPTVKVVDESGKPVEGVTCRIGFAAKPKPPQTEGNLIVEGLTDAEGLFDAEANTGPRIGVRSAKNGYYTSQSIYQYPIAQLDGLEVFPPKWTPYSPMIQVTLKRIINPIALFAKEVETRVPADDKEIGFDLQAGDWVAPHGKGIKPDLLFQTTRNIVSPNDYSVILTLTFPNDGDGLLLVEEEPRLGSELRLSHEAPETDYQPTKTWTYGRKPGETHDGSTVWNEKHNYFLRVRTELNPDGSVKTAHYAKVHGDFRLNPGGPTAGLSFTYYFNPTAKDQNLEFDTSNNLFKGERIKSP